MDALVVLLTLLLVAGVLIVISAPLRARAGERPTTREREQSRGEDERAALEAEREAKYREIRDAELDYRTGKLSQDDYERLDAELRAEAVEILESLDDLDEAEAT
jgi:hypothetical protein